MRLPKGWNEVELGEVATFYMGGTPTVSEINSTYANIPWIKGSDLDKEYIYNANNFITPKGMKNSRARYYEEGTVLIGRTGQGKTRGKTAILKVKATTNETVIAIVPNSSMIKSEYLHFNLKSRYQELRDIGGDDKRGGITQGDLKNLKIRLPPISTQKEIISILEKTEQLKRLRDEADELTNDFSKSVFVEIFGDPVKNPKKWETVNLSELGNLSRGKSKHRPRNDPELLGGKYPLIQTGDVANSEGYITKFTQTYSELGLKQSRMWPSGTLCITIAANIAKTGILTFDSCFPDSIVGFIPNDKTNTEYIQNWLSFLQKTLEDNAPESAQKNINLELLQNLNVPLPPIDIQNRFSAIVKNVSKMKMYQKQSKEQIENMFNNLMQKAFRGELAC